MNSNYNSNLYLTTQDMNDIEIEIESLTSEIRENIFDNQSSPLQNIQVGDNLNGKVLYLSFPRTLYESLPDNNVVIIRTDSGNTIRFYKHVYSSYNRLMVEFIYNNKVYTLYRKDTDENYIRYNVKRFKLPFDFGTVTNIATDNIFYQYIKIYENDSLLPDYERHFWNDNEVLSMQKIDNIEHGVKNIGDYYYKPNGWLTSREWLKDNNINNIDTNTNIQNISYQDLNRWLNNLTLISFDNLDKMTIWDTNITQIKWNEDNDTEWEDY